MSVGSLGQASLSPRRSSLGSSRSSLRRSNESLPTASRSATADAIFVEEFGKGKKEAAAAREGWYAHNVNSPYLFPYIVESVLLDSNDWHPSIRRDDGLRSTLIL